MLRIGAHLTISRGLPEAVRMAEEIGANCFAYFTRNPRGGAIRAMTAGEIETWRAERARADVGPAVGHLPYTVNLAAPKRETWEFARRVVTEDLARANEYGAEFLVVHPGSHLGDGPEAGIERIVRALAGVFEAVPQGPTVLLLETMAGQGSEVGGEPWHLGRICEALQAPERLGVCLDTCHLFAAGYDLRSNDGIDRMLDDLEGAVGLDRLLAVHLNDSRMPLGSRRDRHAKLGQGCLAPEGISALLHHPAIRRLPLILETPVEDYREYADEIRFARQAAGEPWPRGAGPS